MKTSETKVQGRRWKRPVDAGSGVRIPAVTEGGDACLDRGNRSRTDGPVEHGSDEGAGGDAEAVEMCPYTEYDPEDGETYRCGLAKHGPKVKHTRGRKV